MTNRDAMEIVLTMAYEERAELNSVIRWLSRRLSSSVVGATGRTVGIVGPISPEPSFTSSDAHRSAVEGKGLAPSSEVPSGIWVVAPTTDADTSQKTQLSHEEKS